MLIVATRSYPNRKHAVYKTKSKQNIKAKKKKRKNNNEKKGIIQKARLIIRLIS